MTSKTRMHYSANSLPALISISQFASKCVPALYIYIWVQWQNYKRAASFNRVAHTDLCTSWAFIRRSQQNQSWCCITYSLRGSLSSLPPTSRFSVSSMLTAHFIPLKTLDLWKGKGFIRQYKRIPLLKKASSLNISVAQTLLHIVLHSMTMTPVTCNILSSNKQSQEWPCQMSASYANNMFKDSRKIKK